ncbi:hypothetical protein [Streptomyces sp. NPDC002187]|uniref:hypothetical protein n=1 Tax=Streptomyces sp. NPDC002187 TaxID=3364637 RepID=UPI0036A29C75
MRVKSLFAAVAALFVLTACGGDAGGIGPGGFGNGAGQAAQGGDNPADPNEGTLENPTRNGGVNGSAPDDATGFLGLPKAGSMAAAADFINGYTRCDDISVDPQDDDFFPGDEEFDADWSVTERGACGRGTRIFMIKDAKTFQAAYKADLDKRLIDDPEEDLGGGFVIGQDFAVIPTQESAVHSLLQRGRLLMLNCHPSFGPPSGFRKEKALVDGCVLTDYFED